MDSVKSTNQRGLGAPQMIIVAVFVLLIGFVSFRVYQSYHKVTQNAAVSNPVNVPQIKAASNLNSAVQTLDNTPLDTNELTELDAQLDF